MIRNTVAVTVFLIASLLSAHAEKSRQFSCTGSMIEPTSLAPSPRNVKLTLGSAQNVGIDLGQGSSNAVLFVDQPLTGAGTIVGQGGTDAGLTILLTGAGGGQGGGGSGGGGTQPALGGVIVGQGSTDAALTVPILPSVLSGVIVAQGTTDALLTVLLTGAVGGQAGSTGDISAATVLAGGIVGQGSSSAALTGATLSGGVVGIVGQGDTDANLLVLLTGAVGGKGSTWCGGAPPLVPLAGEIVGQGGSDALLTQAVPPGVLVGGIFGQGQASAALTILLTGSLQGQGNFTAAPPGVQPLYGAIVGQGSTTASLSVEYLPPPQTIGGSGDNEGLIGDADGSGHVGAPIFIPPPAQPAYGGTVGPGRRRPLPTRRLVKVKSRWWEAEGLIGAAEARATVVQPADLPLQPVGLRGTASARGRVVAPTSGAVQAAGATGRTSGKSRSVAPVRGRFAVRAAAATVRSLARVVPPASGGALARGPLGVLEIRGVVGDPPEWEREALWLLDLVDLDLDPDEPALAR